MNMPVLNESDALARLDKPAVLGALETAFGGLMNGRSVQPAQTVTVFPDGRGDCIFYPGALLDLGLIGVKVSPYLTELGDAGESPVTAYTLLLSASDGQPRLLCDSYALTTVRTAATTALALKYLTPDGSKSLALIGTGTVGREHLSYATQLQGWDRISAFSSSASDDAERQALVTAAAGQEVIFARSAEEAVRDADVVLLCTSSGTPVIEYAWLTDGALVTSISTNSPGAHEIDPESLANYDVFCDYRATAPTTAGEMKIAIEAGSWTAESIVADLAELVTGTSVPGSGKPRFFRSTGLGIEDLAIAALLVD